MSKPESRCIAFDTLIQITSGSCPKVLAEARKTVARFKRTGELGKPGRGTHGIPVNVWVTEERGHMFRTIWQDGSQISGPWREHRSGMNRKPRQRYLKEGERVARKLKEKKERRK